MPARHRRAEPERVAERDCVVAEPEVGRGPDLHRIEAAFVDTDHGEVVVGGGAEHAPREACARR